LRLIERETQYHDKGGNNPIFQSYYKKYDTPGLPACWMLGEILSFGTWSKIYQNLLNGRDKKQIARKFNIPHYHVFESWLHAACFTRNLCAHHAMICLKNFHITPVRLLSWQLSEQKIFDKQHTVFLQAAIVQFLLKSASPNTKLAPLLTILFNKYPTIQIAKMGFDAGWENHEVWQ
jgi:abortive infection bacteriophage resistance protein